MAKITCKVNVNSPALLKLCANTQFWASLGGQAYLTKKEKSNMHKCRKCKQNFVMPSRILPVDGKNWRDWVKHNKQAQKAGKKLICWHCW